MKLYFLGCPKAAAESRLVCLAELSVQFQDLAKVILNQLRLPFSRRHNRWFACFIAACLIIARRSVYTVTTDLCVASSVEATPDDSDADSVQVFPYYGFRLTCYNSLSHDV